MSGASSSSAAQPAGASEQSQLVQTVMLGGDTWTHRYGTDEQKAVLAEIARAARQASRSVEARSFARGDAVLNNL